MFWKIGTFIFWAGVMGLALFGISIAAGAADFNLFILGGLAFLGGAFLRMVSKHASPPPSQRFGIFKRSKKPAQPPNKK